MDLYVSLGIGLESAGVIRVQWGMSESNKGSVGVSRAQWRLVGCSMVQCSTMDSVCSLYAALLIDPSATTILCIKT